MPTGPADAANRGVGTGVLILVLAFIGPRCSAAGVSVGGSSGAAFTTPTQCLDLDRAELRQLHTADRDLIYVEAPTIVPGSTVDHVIGSPAFAYSPSSIAPFGTGSRPLALQVGAAVGIGNVRMIPPPDGVALLQDLRAFRAGSDSLHLLWREDRSDGDIRLRQGRWDGTAWSVETRAADGSADLWTAIGTSLPVTESDGSTTVLVLPPLPMNGRAGSLVTASRTLRIASDVTGPYPSLSPSLGRHRAMSYVANAAPDGNAVFSRFSDDDARTWSNPVRVSPEASGSADWPVLLSLRDGALALVWLADWKVLRMSVSPDGGRTWRLGDSLSLRGGITAFRATARNATVYIVAIQADSTANVIGEGSPLFLTWEPVRSWSMHRLASTERAFGMPAIALSGRHLLAAWGSPLPGVPQRPVTVLARVPISCGAAD